MGLKSDFLIGDRFTVGDVTVTVTKNQEQLVTLDIDAPKSTKIEIQKQKPWDSNRGHQISPAEQRKMALAKLKGPCNHYWVNTGQNQKRCKRCFKEVFYD